MKTVEDIVKAKQYFELTPEELMLVSEVVESEDAYEKLQYLLRHTEQYFENHKVKASDGMRDHIMEKLYPPVSASTAWYKTLGAYFFPPNKHFYQYPSFQLVTLLLLFVGFFSLLKNPIEQENLAVVQVEEVKGEVPSQIETEVVDSNKLLHKEETKSEPKVPKKVSVLSPSQEAVHNNNGIAVITEDLDTKEAIHPPIANEPQMDLTSIPNTPEVNTASAVNERLQLLDEVSAVELKEEIIEANQVVTPTLSSSAPVKSIESVKYADFEVKKQSRKKADLMQDKQLSRINVVEVNNLKMLFFEVK